jgi:hypothetical protein
MRQDVAHDHEPYDDEQYGVQIFQAYAHYFNLSKRVKIVLLNDSCAVGSPGFIEGNLPSSL